MKKMIAQRISLFLLLLAAVPAYAECNLKWFCRENRCRQDFECGVNPLECGSFGIQLQGGVYPIIWNKRGDILLSNCSGFLNPVGTITSLGELPKFNNLYKVPWVIGGQLSYALSCNTNVFVEFNYAQSSGSKCNFCNLTPATLTLMVSKYKLYNGYVGVRYYFDRWCDRVSFFIGEKVGFVHHKGANFNSLTPQTSVTDYTNLSFFNSNTVISGGAQFGLDICGWCGFNFVITGEVVASGGPRLAQNITLSTSDAALLTGQVLRPGYITTELSFPVTFGVKYNF